MTLQAKKISSGTLTIIYEVYSPQIKHTYKKKNQHTAYREITTIIQHELYGVIEIRLLLLIIIITSVYLQDYWTEPTKRAVQGATDLSSSSVAVDANFSSDSAALKTEEL